jgi:hypothetical protein
VKDALSMIPELPYKGGHLEIVKECKKLVVRIVEENRLIAMLKDAIESQELNRLQGALSSAESMDPPMTEADTPLIAEGKELIKKIELLTAARVALQQAITARDIPALVAGLAQAAEIGFKGAELEQATTLKARLEQEDAALVALTKAIDLNELAALNTAINAAQDLGLSERAEVSKAIAAKEVIMEQMMKDAALQAELERARLAEEEANRKRQAAQDGAMSGIKSAINSRDRDELQAAIEKVANMGIHNDEVQMAQTILKNLDSLSEAKTKIDAVLKQLRSKASSGLVSRDLVRLKDAIKAGAAVLEEAPDLPFPELDEAQDLLKTYREQASINERLITTVESGDRVAIRKALDEAENLGLTLDSMDVAHETLRELEMVHREAKAEAGESYEEEEEPYDEAEEARVKRQQVASQPKYAFQYFSGLRTSDDFARGTYTLWGKNTVRLSHLVHQTDKLPKSITMLPKELSKRAKEIFQNLLGYMGDKQMPFAPMLAQDVLRKGFDTKGLRDEIYCQIIKQLTNNPRPESVAKGWQLLCMCVATFPPSFDFEMYLMHFILERRDTGRGVVVSFAKYCLRTLEAMLSHGEGVGYVPQVEEIKAFAERPPVLATISLVDGATLVTDLPVTPDTNVLKILEMCVQWTELSDTRVDSLGIFVYDLGDISEKKGKPTAFDDLERTPRPLRNDDFLGDVYITKARQKRDFKLIFKKKIFLPKENYRGDDPGFDRLLYLQAEDETIIQGNIELPDDKTAAYLASISMAVCFGTEIGSSVEELSDGQQVQDFIALGWRDQKVPAEWGEMVLQHREGMLPTAESEEEDPDHTLWFANLQWLFVETVQESPMYGMHWFYCHPNISPRKKVPDMIRNLPYNMALAFNSEGLHLFTEDHECVASYGYADIFRWGGSTGLFSIILADEEDSNFELCVITSQSTDLAAIILDHIHAIMSHGDEAEEE